MNLYSEATSACLDSFLKRDEGLHQEKVYRRPEAGQLRSELAACKRQKEKLEVAAHRQGPNEKDIFRIAGQYQHFKRANSPQGRESLAGSWSEIPEIAIAPRTITYNVRRLYMIESNALNRLTTDVEDAVIRMLTARAVSRSSANRLEIGVFFGKNVLNVWGLFRGQFRSVNITCIGPLGVTKETICRTR